MKAANDWYAVRTVPGAQKPKREYIVEKTSSKRGKGYRIIPSLDPNMSAIERALKDNKFSFYMPAEKRLVRDRRHTDLWKVRRFALIVGYVFVHRPHDLDLLKQTAGVQDIVKTADGEPLSIDLLDILALRAAEAEAEVEFDRQSRSARQKVRRRAKEDPRLQKLVAKLDIAGNYTVPYDFDFEAA
jgi:hypothetical protein